MPSIVSYRKYIDAQVTRELRLPEDTETRQRLGTELATIEGVTYVSLPDGVTLPAEQPQEIAANVSTVKLTDALRDAIKAASPHVRLINERVQTAISERYSMADELKLLRTAPSAEFTAYNAYAEECRAWGRAEKAKLGL
jgi:hypothetical protein